MQPKEFAVTDLIKRGEKELLDNTDENIDTDNKEMKTKEMFSSKQFINISGPNRISGKCSSSRK